MRFIATASLVTVAVAQSSLNEFTRGGCKDAVMIFARGSTEPGNVGMIIGPPLFRELRKLVPSLAIEGVPYAAGLGTNMVKGGADPKGIAAATKLFNDAHSKCPQSALLGGGYSQGAAVMHRSIEALPEAVKKHIAGVALYGDTQNKQDKAQIKNFPVERVKVFCNKNDGVCGGGLAVNAGHMSYSKDMGNGAKFLAERISSWKGSNGGASSSSSSESSDSPSPKMSKGKAGKGSMGKSPKAPKAPKAPKTPKAAEPAAPAEAAAEAEPAAPAEMAGMEGMEGGHSHGRRFVQW